MDQLKILSKSLHRSTEFSCFFALSVAIFCIHYICASVIDRKNIVFVVSKLIEPPWGHDWYNSDNVQHNP